jgi:hypothetical protein
MVNMKMRAVAMMLLFLLVGIPSQVALACSFGPPHSLNYQIENADYIVRATVIQVDDASFNAILQADTYLMGGSGPERLLLSRASPYLTSISYGHHYNVQCSGVGPIGIGTNAYFAVKRASDGSYFTFFNSLAYYREFDELATPEVYLRIDPDGEDVDENLQWVEVDSDEAFMEVVAELSGETPATPSEMRFGFPLIAPMLITTENGTQYTFPIDGGDLAVNTETTRLTLEWSPVAYPSLFNLPPFCAAVDCRLWTPDVSFGGEQVDENTIHFNYGWLEEPLVVEGQAFAFSSTSEFVLVWNDDMLNLMLISNDWCNECVGGFIPSFDLLSSLPLNMGSDATALYGLAMWSADGTTFTYGDADGVWVFDIFHQSEPELVVPVEGDALPSPLFLSTNGRYLAYTWNRADDDWTTLDRLTGETFENAMISPNERFMAQIAPLNPEPRPDVAGCNVPMMYDCHRTFGNSLRYFEWIGEQSYMVSRCADDSNEDCELGASEVSYLIQPINQNVGIRQYSGWLGDIDYQPQQQMLAFVIAPQTIALNDERIAFDFGDQLDGAIVDIEWLPSLFYFSR